MSVFVLYLRHLAALLILSMLVVTWAVRADTRDVKVGVIHNPPIIVLEEGSAPKGLAIDVLELVAKREGWNLVWVRDKWRNLLAKLEAGEIDLQPGIAFSKARAERFSFTKEALIGNWGTLYRRSDVEYHTITDISTKRVAVVSNATHTRAFETLAREFGVTLSPHEVESYTQAFEAVAAGQAEFAVVSRLFGILNADRHNLLETGTIFNPIEVRYAAPLGRNADLLDAMDSFLAQEKFASNSDYQNFLRRWLSGSPERAIPAWIWWAVAGTATIILFLVSVLWWLRQEVAERTASLRISQNKLVNAQYIAKLGDFEWDFRTGKVLWSPGVYKLTGYEPGEVDLTIDFVKAHIHHAEDAAYLAGMIASAIDDRRDRLSGVRYRIVRKSGEAIHVESDFVIEYSNQTVTRLFGVCRDITDRIEHERDLEEAMTHAIAANNSKSEFLATMSHELRTPLNAILGFAQMLKMNPHKNLTKDQLDYIGLIDDGGKHLLSLVEDLLDLTQIELQRAAVHPDFVEVEAVIVETMNHIRPPGQSTDIDIHIDCEQGRGGHIVADRLRLKQVLINLLSNAIRYNKPGGVVEVFAERPGDDVLRISVRDTGIGIDEEFHDRVFQPFTRINADSMTSQHGVGIGLSICKVLIERMGGRIHFESHAGTGSTFSIELPFTESATVNREEAN